LNINYLLIASQLKYIVELKQLVGNPDRPQVSFISAIEANPVILEGVSWWPGAEGECADGHLAAIRWRNVSFSAGN
jgi:hypothetical protein